MTVSDFNVEFLRREYAAHQVKVVRIYNGLNLDDFPYSDPGNRPPRIVAVGRLVEKKGFADLVDACALLAEGGDRFVCDIVGEGELHDDLQRRIAASRLQGVVRLLGARPQCEVIRLVGNAAAFAAPCVVGADGNRDGLPTVLLESMALGTPCVATAVTGIPEIIHDQVTGLIVSQRSPAELAQKLRGLLHNAELRIRLAREARGLIECEFDIDRNSEVLRQVFQSTDRAVVARHRGSGIVRLAYVCMDPGIPVFGHKGCSVHVQEVIRALAAIGVHVELFACRLGGDAPDDLQHVPIHQLPVPMPREPAERERLLLAANRSLRRILQDSGPFDVVYERYSLWSHAGMEHARRTSSDGILEVNSPLIEEQSRHRRLVHRAAAEHVLRRNVRNASAIVAVSAEVSRLLARYTNPSRVHVVENGVDPSRFDHHRTSQMRREGFTVGFVGTLKPWHGVEQLIEAFARLVQTRPDSHLLIVGDGPRLESLREVALARLGDSRGFSFLGAVPPADVPDLLLSMDVCGRSVSMPARFLFFAAEAIRVHGCGKAGGGQPHRADTARCSAQQKWAAL